MYISILRAALYYNAFFLINYFDERYTPLHVRPDGTKAPGNIHGSETQCRCLRASRDHYIFLVQNLRYQQCNIDAIIQGGIQTIIIHVESNTRAVAIFGKTALFRSIRPYLFRVYFIMHYLQTLVRARGAKYCT